MAELKTQKSKASVTAFLDTVENEEKRKDCKTLLKLFKEVTGDKAVMWGTSIIGYGSYHYKSERSSQAGEWFMTGFSPRKAYIAIYLIYGVNKFPQQLKKLGKFKVSTGSCLYVKRLSDIDLTVLKEMIKESVKAMKKQYN